MPSLETKLLRNPLLLRSCVVGDSHQALQPVRSIGQGGKSEHTTARHIDVYQVPWCITFFHPHYRTSEYGVASFRTQLNGMGLPYAYPGHVSLLIKSKPKLYSQGIHLTYFLVR